MPEIEDGDGGNVPDLRDYGRTISRHRGLIAVTVVVAVAAALGFSVMQKPVYKATSQLIIQRSDTLSTSSQSADDAARNVVTETAVLKSRAVRDAARKKLGHDASISVTSSGSSDVVSVTASSSHARQAATDSTVYTNVYIALRRKQNIDDLAQAGAQLQLRVNNLNRQINGLRPGSAALATAESQLGFLQQQIDQLHVSANLTHVGGARLLSSAGVPGAPVSPKPIRNMAIAFVLGLLLAIGLAFLREYLDDTVTTREELERATGLPILGEIPRITSWRDRAAAHLVTSDEPTSPAAEGYRTLRTSIEFLAVDRPFKSIQITSSQTDDGKTTTLANLALAFARSGIDVTIVCCDLRRPRIHEFFGLPNEVGFTSVLLGKVSVLDALQRVNGEPRLAIMSAGPASPNPSEWLASAQAADTIEAIKGSSLVLVDSPPVLPVSDALIVSGLVEATLLVAGANSSSRRGLQRTVQLLRQVKAPLVGTVLNNADISEGDGSYGYGYFGPSSNGADGAQTRWQWLKGHRAAS